MAAGFNTCQVIEAIQNLPPELREIIYKHYLAIKLKERGSQRAFNTTFLSWNGAACTYYSVCNLYALLLWRVLLPLL